MGRDNSKGHGFEEATTVLCVFTILQRTEGRAHFKAAISYHLCSVVIRLKHGKGAEPGLLDILI